MRLNLPPSLHYPITVTELLKQPNEEVQRSEPLFSYFYKSKREVTDRDGEVSIVEENLPSRFESSVDGTLQKWFLKKGTVVTQPGGDVVEIEEPCDHSVQFGGMCVTCGKDMTERTYATTQVDANRANIRMIHDNTALTVSEAEATRAEEEVKRRLITSKKLSLVVDLDQTIIHATVDPTVAEWQKDPDNPNYEALRDVKAFQLVDDGPGGRGTWYYIKLRPGLPEFLERVSKMYELHIYTMGTRAYAQHIAELVDPNRKIFGNRILSRDESGSLVAKNLQRIFPVDTNMVVVIDDRGDVWNWNPNLIKVTQFSFFVGIGDINSSFLPKREPKIRPLPKPPASDAQPSSDTPPGGPSISESDTAAQNSPEQQQPNDNPSSPSAPASALEQLVAISNSASDPATLEEQSAQQDEALNAQLQDRPLAQMQQKLDASTSSSPGSASPGEDGDSESDSSSDSPSQQRPRHHLLNDTDNELFYLEHSLQRVHAAFFSAYASRMADASGGRLAELRGAPSSKKPSPSSNTDLALIPDVKSIMPALKQKALAGVSIVFSGVIPLDAEVHSAEISIWARSFGARIQDRVSGRSTTHVVAARNRTAKVRQAVRRGRGRIRVVSPAWLMACLVQWTRVDEGPYLLKTDEESVGKPLPGELEEDDEGGIMSESASASGSEDESRGITDAETEITAESDEGKGVVMGKDGKMVRQRLRLNIKPPPSPHVGANGPLNGDVPPELDHDVPSSSSSVLDSEDGDGPRGRTDPMAAALLEELAEADKSPVGGTDADWKDMHDEMAEFLGSDVSDESDGDSIASIRSSQSSRANGNRLKRGRDENESDRDADGDDGGARKKARSQLSSELDADAMGSGFLTPPTVKVRGGDGDGGEVAENEVDEDGEEEDGPSDFDDLEREMEKAAAEVLLEEKEARANGYHGEGDEGGG